MVDTMWQMERQCQMQDDFHDFIGDAPIFHNNWGQGTLEELRSVNRGSLSTELRIQQYYLYDSYFTPQLCNWENKG